MSTRCPISPLFWARVSRSGIVAAGGVGPSATGLAGSRVLPGACGEGNSRLAGWAVSDFIYLSVKVSISRVCQQWPKV